ncbi:ubiquinone/menaquinone biosynthesis protein [Achromatium sp. WMS3]|nr:ubiquinone/menaquinone biosynthesis protein [Achromatium sp. WMS3]
MSESNDSQSFDIIKESHALSGEPEQLAEFYQKWADTYDEDVSNEEYTGPEYITNYFIDILQKENNQADNQLKILDAGCGTGLVGIVLDKKGYHNLDGCDLSEEMVEVAKQTGVYQTLNGGIDINNMKSFSDAQYDATISCGVFTLGHVPPTAIKELLRITKKDGLVVVSTRSSYYDSTDFQAVCDSLEQEGQVKILDHSTGPYIAEEDAHYWAFRVC